jgi:hypothetical protein
MQRQQRLKDDKGRFISANPPRMTIDKDGTITGGPKPKAKAKAKAKATISKRKPMTAETREANRELARRCREVRAKRLATQTEQKIYWQTSAARNRARKKDAQSNTTRGL